MNRSRDSGAEAKIKKNTSRSKSKKSFKQQTLDIFLNKNKEPKVHAEGDKEKKVKQTKLSNFWKVKPKE